MEGGKRHHRYNIRVKIEPRGNDTYEATLFNTRPKDDKGALIYVIAVIFIYGFSIVMMIASHIRKNKMDRKLNNYLKEMAVVRKREQQFMLVSAAAKAAAAKQGEIDTPSKLAAPSFLYPEINEENDWEPGGVKIGQTRTTLLPDNRESRLQQATRISFGPPNTVTIEADYSKDTGAQMTPDRDHGKRQDAHSGLVFDPSETGPHVAIDRCGNQSSKENSAFNDSDDSVFEESNSTSIEIDCQPKHLEQKHSLQKEALINIQVVSSI